MKPHKHADLIKAWADGAKIQLHVTWNDTWMDYKGNEVPAWNPEYEYRVKPEPKPDFIDEVSIYQNAYWKFESERNTDKTFKFQPIYLGELRLVWDGETGKLKSAEVL